MTLSAGVRLGPYEIQAPIGAGGMGEVYEAKDTRLGRTVAIKVLPEGVAADPDRRRRFEQEARAASALNHPHICVLHDIGDAVPTCGSPIPDPRSPIPAPVSYLVMEHLEGETLAKRLVKGPVPLDHALDIGAQIADALSAAHRHGIIHRDLKPANVMLVKGDGGTKPHVKLLDFGLAKLKASPEPAGNGASTPDTRTDDGRVLGTVPYMAPEPAGNGASTPDTRTDDGRVLGTVPYMAPEQVEGRPADARTDVFAFGAVLYEMLAGKRAFEGDSSAAVMAAILEHEPPALSSHQPMTPPALDRLVKRCLAKDPDARWQSAADVADELRWLQETSGVGVAARVQTRRRVGLRTVLVYVVGAAMIGAGLMWLLRPSAPTAAVVRLTLDVRPADELNSGGFAGDSSLTPGGLRTALTWTPDGQALVFVGRRNGVQQLYLRRLAAAEAQPLANTEGALIPAVSPDGRWVAFWANKAIRRVAIRGGPATQLAPNVGFCPTGLAWVASNRLLFGNFAVGAPISQIPVRGQPGQDPATDRVTPVTKVPDGEDMHSMPWALPGGRALIYTVRKGGYSWGSDEVMVQTPGATDRKLLLPDADDARYVASGHLVFLRRGVLFAAPFDAARRVVLDKPVPVLEDTVAQALSGTHSTEVAGAGQFALSSTGALAYVPSPVIPYPPSNLVAVDRAGAITQLPVSGPPASYSGFVRLSPDRRRLAVSIRTLTEESLWTYDLERHALDPIIRDGEAWSFAWSPDGQGVVFGWLKDGRRTLAWKSVNRDEPARVRVNGFLVAPSFTNDGQEIIAIQGPTRIVKITPDNRIEPLIGEFAGYPELSPDGRWVAYGSNGQVYVRAYPGRGPDTNVSVSGGFTPAWHPNGRELFFVTRSAVAGRDRMMVADFAPGSPPRIGRSRELFSYDPRELALSGSIGRIHDTDGQRFYAVQRSLVPPSPPVTHINVILNWVEELKAKVPVK